METTEIETALVTIPIFELKEPETHVLFVCSDIRHPPTGNVLIRSKFLTILSRTLLLPEAQVCSDLKSAICLMRHSPLGRYGEHTAKRMALDANALSIQYNCNPMVIFYPRKI